MTTEISPLKGEDGGGGKSYSYRNVVTVVMICLAVLALVTFMYLQRTKTNSGDLTTGRFEPFNGINGEFDPSSAATAGIFAPPVGDEGTTGDFVLGDDTNTGVWPSVSWNDESKAESVPWDDKSNTVFVPLDEGITSGFGSLGDGTTEFVQTNEDTTTDFGLQGNELTTGFGQPIETNNDLGPLWDAGTTGGQLGHCNILITGSGEADGVYRYVDPISGEPYYETDDDVLYIFFYAQDGAWVISFDYEMSDSEYVLYYVYDIANSPELITKVWSKPEISAQCIEGEFCNILITGANSDVDGVFMYTTEDILGKPVFKRTTPVDTYYIYVGPDDSSWVIGTQLGSGSGVLFAVYNVEPSPDLVYKEWNQPSINAQCADYFCDIHITGTGDDASGVYTYNREKIMGKPVYKMIASNGNYFLYVGPTNAAWIIGTNKGSGTGVLYWVNEVARSPELITTEWVQAGVNAQCAGRTIFDGCPAVGNEGSICGDADTGRGAVRCCSITGTSCSTLDLGCHSDKMFSEATDICTSNSMRLCTSTELQSGVCCGTGCNFDTELVWTSDGCSSEYPWTPFTEGNCNCAESRLFETAAYPTVGQCGEHCVSNYVQCRSFAVWTSAHNTGYCAGYDTACTSPCQIPTSAPNTNNVFNIISEWSLFAANGNCNCGDRLATHSSGYETEEKCGPLCASNSACQSFGIWTNLELGTCILFDTLCTATCSNPTSEGWANDIYNMNADATNR